jgi:RecJ-like exonuclease
LPGDNRRRRIEKLMKDSSSRVPAGTEWCPECNGYGSSLMEETERCTRCGGSGLVVVVAPAEQPSNGENPPRPSQQDLN